jgi:hypothetical protein
MEITHTHWFCSLFLGLICAKYPVVREHIGRVRLSEYEQWGTSSQGYYPIQGVNSQALLGAATVTDMLLKSMNSKILCTIKEYISASLVLLNELLFQNSERLC